MSLAVETPSQQAHGFLAGTDRQICAVILLLFVLAAALSALRKDVTRGFDEVAQASYVATIQHDGEIRPNLADMRLLDASSFRFTAKPSYLNHPSPYYVVLARVGPTLEDHPGAIMAHRFFNIALAAIGLAALMAIGIAANFPRAVLYANIVPLACIPVLIPLAGSINNDNAAFAGGGIAMLGTFLFLATEKRAALLAALTGLVIASWAKLTGFVLVGGMLAGVSAWLFWHKRLTPLLASAIAIAMLLALQPYVALFLDYGSVAPTTPGQVLMLKDGAHLAGWDTAARLSPIAYVVHFASEFISGWMPSLSSRNALNYAALAIPCAAALCAYAGLMVAARRILRGSESAMDVMVAASGLAFTAALIIHVVFAYKRHLLYGWMMEAYPRYYLPLMGFVPLAGITLLGAVKSPRTRALLGGFLVAGPIVFRLIGAPIG
jgi:hypothetical protein